MKSLLTLCVILFLPTARPAQAAFNPLSLIDLVVESERVVRGTIVAVADDAFEFQIDDVIVGPGKVGDRLTVRQFRNWACAWRPRPYEKGQAAVLFLGKRSDGRLGVLGAGNEGEFTVFANERIEWSDSYLGETLGRWVYALSPVREDELQAVQTISYDVFRSAVADLRHAFRLTSLKEVRDKNGVLHRTYNVEQISEDPAPKSFQKRSPPGTKPPERPFEDRSWLHREIMNELIKMRSLR